jgi:hypothetical protein
VERSWGDQLSQFRVRQKASAPRVGYVNRVSGHETSERACRWLQWVKLGRKLDVSAESAFPTIADIVDYGRDLRHAFIRSWLPVYEFTP